jgi:hypothetical protein
MFMFQEHRRVESTRFQAQSFNRHHQAADSGNALQRKKEFPLIYTTPERTTLRTNRCPIPAKTPAKLFNPVLRLIGLIVSDWHMRNPERTTAC